MARWRPTAPLGEGKTAYKSNLLRQRTLWWVLFIGYTTQWLWVSFKTGEQQLSYIFTNIVSERFPAVPACVLSNSLSVCCLNLLLSFLWNPANGQTSLRWARSLFQCLSFFFKFLYGGNVWCMIIHVHIFSCSFACKTVLRCHYTGFLYLRAQYSTNDKSHCHINTERQGLV